MRTQRVTKSTNLRHPPQHPWRRLVRYFLWHPPPCNPLNPLWEHTWTYFRLFLLFESVVQEEPSLMCFNVIRKSAILKPAVVLLYHLITWCNFQVATTVSTDNDNTVCMLYCVLYVRRLVPLFFYCSLRKQRFTIHYELSGISCLANNLLPTTLSQKGFSACVFNPFFILLLKCETAMLLRIAHNAIKR